ncbi:hypothetical protein, conserved [Angomonas deanei]|uniref:Uncharacterized protein n=1 Tax=Angomonas deanei TaxID=59799 RepID=A0A7G2CNX9_9TRYP|nr:hypothetical protein, conserved [Angomonas deanei]
MDESSECSSPTNDELVDIQDGLQTLYEASKGEWDCDANTLLLQTLSAMAAQMTSSTSRILRRIQSLDEKTQRGARTLSNTLVGLELLSHSRFVQHGVEEEGATAGGASPAIGTEENTKKRPSGKETDSHSVTEDGGSTVFTVANDQEGQTTRRCVQFIQQIGKVVEGRIVPRGEGDDPTRAYQNPYRYRRTQVSLIGSKAFLEDPYMGLYRGPDGLLESSDGDETLLNVDNEPAVAINGERSSYLPSSTGIAHTPSAPVTVSSNTAPHLSSLAVPPSGSNTVAKPARTNVFESSSSESSEDKNEKKTGAALPPTTKAQKTRGLFDSSSSSDSEESSTISTTDSSGSGTSSPASSSDSTSVKTEQEPEKVEEEAEELDVSEESSVRKESEPSSSPDGGTTPREWPQEESDAAPLPAEEADLPLPPPPCVFNDTLDPPAPPAIDAPPSAGPAVHTLPPKGAKIFDTSSEDDEG